MLTPAKFMTEEVEDQEKARNQFLAYLLLANVDQDKHKKTIDDLNNDYLLKKGNFPADVPKMEECLTNRRGGKSSKKVEHIRDGGTELKQVLLSFPRRRPRRYASSILGRDTSTESARANTKLTRKV